MIQLRKCHGGRLENTAFTLAVQFGGRNSVYRYFMSPVPRLPRVFIAAYITRPELRGSQKFPSRDRSEFVSFAGDSFTARNCCNVTTKIGQLPLYSWSFLLHYVYVQKFLRCVQFEFLRCSSLSAFSTDDRISQRANDESYARKILLTAWLKLSNVSWQKVSTQFVGTRRCAVEIFLLPSGTFYTRDDCFCESFSRNSWILCSFSRGKNRAAKRCGVYKYFKKRSVDVNRINEISHRRGDCSVIRKSHYPTDFVWPVVRTSQALLPRLISQRAFFVQWETKFQRTNLSVRLSIRASNENLACDAAEQNLFPLFPWNV